MIIQPANRLQSVSEYYFSHKLKQLAQLKQDGWDIINLGIGSPDMPPSNSTIGELCDTVNEGKGNVHGYQSYWGMPELVTSMRNWYDKVYEIEMDGLHVVPLMGSKEGIMHISMAFLNKGDQVLVPNPGYPTYQSVSKLVEAEIIPYNLTESTNWEPDFNELEALDTSRVKIMWVNYPHMPTGKKANLRLFQRLVNFCTERHILLVHDNPYSLILNDNPLSIFNADGAEEVAVELNSLSKSHNMAGWRVGMCVGKPEYIQTIMKVKSNMDSGMFSGIQKGAIAALNNSQTWHDLQGLVYKRRRNVVYHIMDCLGCVYSKDSAGMFVWGRIPDDWESSEAMSEEILQNSKVFITPGFIFGSNGNRYIRISLCSNEMRLTEALNRIDEKFNKTILSFTNSVV